MLAAEILFRICEPDLIHLLLLIKAMVHIEADYILVYASNNPAGNGNKPDIFCRYSTDQGVTWSSPV